MSDRFLSVKGLAAALVLSVAFSGAATAQEAPKAAAPAAPAAKPAAKAEDGAGPQAKDAKGDEAKTAWYKICAKVPIVGKGPDGKETKEEKNACTTFYESFNPATGAPLVYVAVEEGEGIDKKVLTVVVPPGLALPPGMAITVFQKDQWEKFVKENKEGKTVKPEDVGLKPIELKYLHCHSTGCASVSELASDFLEQMKSGVGMIVRAVELNNKVVDFPVPLKGFVEAYGGAPVDTKEFMSFRGERLKEMQQRRAELIEQFKKERATQKGAAGGAAAPAAKPADKAAAPAEKK